MVEYGPSNGMVPEGKERLNLQLEGDLKRWAKDYAKRNHTTMTAIITKHFRELQAEDRRLRGYVDVEQI